MANYAVVKDGVVENIVVWDGQTAFSIEGSEIVEATDDTRIGGSWDGNAFTFVEPPIPEPTAEQVARQEKLDSVKSKLEALGLTTEEVREAFGL
jgi:spore coat protein CotH